MIKRYSMTTEEKAKELIALLSDEPNPTVTKTTHGIVCLGFQNVYKYNEVTQESELIKEAITYDIDVFWKNEPNINWLDFEVNPSTPNHNFA